MPYVPMLGETVGSIEPQFGPLGFDSLSFRTTPIEIHGVDNDESIVGHATGFFWRRNGKSYLITNRHVVTNRNGFTTEYVNQCLQPLKITFYAGEWISPNLLISGQTGQMRFARTAQKILLYNDDNTAAWFEDPLFNQYRTDIVAIPISYSPTINHPTQNPFLNEFGYDSLHTFVGADVFIVGYPYRNYEGMMIPIWKRGSIAAEPQFPVDKNPLFFVDALTKDGMSGSPVFRRTFGPAPLANGVLQLDNFVTTEFVGVYSGRMGSTELAQAAIGMAWYANRIDKIIDAGRFPTFADVHP